MKRSIRLVTALAAFAQIAFASCATGLITYFHEDSVWLALSYAGGSFVLMQLGYFSGVLYIVCRERRNGREERSEELTPWAKGGFDPLH